MGIIRLGQFLKNTYPRVWKQGSVDSYRQGIFAVDASSTIYSFLAKTISTSSSNQPSPDNTSTYPLTPMAT